MLGLTSLTCANLHADPFNGAYVNLGIGGTNLGTEVEQASSFNDVDGGAIQTNIGHVYNNKFASSIGLGYNFPIAEKFSIGIEATGNFTNAKTSSSSVFYAEDTVTNDAIALQQNIDVKLSNDFALLIKPSFAIDSQTRFYGLIGPRWGKFKTSYNATFADKDAGVISTASNNNSKSGYVTGFTVGAGIERYLGQNFGIGLEYTYTNYGKLPKPSDTSSVLGATESFDTELGKVKAQTNSVFLKVFYHFG